MSPANQPVPPSSPIAGSVLPIRRAEELLTTLPGVIAARIVASESGAVDEIHVLTTADVTPKQTVRNIESALIAHLGMRVDHRKISVATTTEGSAAEKKGRAEARPAPAEARPPAADARPAAADARPATADLRPPTAETRPLTTADAPPAGSPMPAGSRRRFYFEDVQVRRSRTKGLACRVTLKKGDDAFVGEAEGVENTRSRLELAARAALTAIRQAEGEQRVLALEGSKLIDAFERQFVFVGVTARVGRESALLTGSCEVKDSPETASVLAILDATNRWIGQAK